MVTGKVTQFIFCHKGRTRATTLTIGTDVVLFFTGILHGTTWNTCHYWTSAMVTGKVTQFIFCHKGRTRATTLTIGTDVVLFFTGILYGTTWNTWDYVITGTSVPCDVCPPM
jgi:hypothetical protein